MSPSQAIPRRGRAVVTALGAMALTASSVTVLTAPSATAAPAPKAADWDATAYRGQVEVIPSNDNDQSVLKGRVFVDRDRDSRTDAGERGLSGVVVSNGREVVKTDRQGNYELPAYDNMTVFITQPAGYQVPVDEFNIAQFHYNHLPEGSPELRYGGIEPTGPLPSAVNFPLTQSRETKDAEQNCVIAGDLQFYNMREVGYARDGAIADLAKRDDYQGCGPLFIGDVVGDDLSLYSEVKDLSRQLNGPVRFLPGNHDLDFDAETAEHSFDTFREQLAPAYFSYDVGKTHVIALNTVRYPCTPDVDNADGQHPNCNDPVNRPAYNGRLGEDQLAWLERDIATTPSDKLIVVASHIPLLTFADEGSPVHQVDQVNEVHELLEGRKAVAVAGHTHTIENMKTGDLFKGWNDIFGIEGLPFPHIVAGAISGDWYSGALTEDGYPIATGRDGARPGVLTLNIKGNTFKERFTVTGESDDFQMQLGINSPHYRDWYVARQAWNRDEEGEAPQLGDGRVVSKADLAGTTWLTTNFWMGATGSKVKVSIDGGKAQNAVRTQEARGEGQLVGPEFSDPHAIAQQLVNGGSLADRAIHLWRLKLPTDLKAGTHRATVTATDSYGREFTESMIFKVVDER
ncbi:calcineurin-like phosphoesterase C-terminal domain-containing protein [Actinopolymorpha pittospori]|uniref:3',5'-cyclic AMP phosphodiesterase CpdA n=1 Tax=Actinopolymorpha pittospori TaxID=648752 RepID=A0A927RNP9_9ACTN|nr:calcineurin-like phosphoesterase family protein [Actinopolymorpha pittospori]MBE1610293.1 3',5'-cyclic AMP phosphodiesterase CpdA [Actinopolymorpha pittospori]